MRTHLDEEGQYRHPFGVIHGLVQRQVLLGMNHMELEGVEGMV